MSALRVIEGDAGDESSSTHHFTPSLQAAIHRAARLASNGAQLRLVKGNAPVEDRPLFRSARDAVKFAASREGSPGRPIASRMVDATVGGRDLVGLDGAAQAGMILNVLEGLGKPAVAVLIASAVPRSIPCGCRRACCAGHAVNRYWREAMDVLCQEAGNITRASYAIRWQLLSKVYTGKGNLKEIADEAQADEKTIGKHHKAICRWLRGARGKDGEVIEGLESSAWSEAETLLRQVGIVG